jgi:hypothetical protein
MLTQLVKERLVKKIPPERIREGNEKPAGATNIFRTLNGIRRQDRCGIYGKRQNRVGPVSRKGGGEHKVYVDAAYAIS